jgi:hypothetical protein
MQLHHHSNSKNFKESNPLILNDQVQDSEIYLRVKRKINLIHLINLNLSV